MMLKTNTLTPPMAARRPHEVISLLRGMHRAVKILLDPRATLPETEEMYAVFEEKSAVCALTALFVGFARYASINTLTAEEQPRKIFLHLKGDRRTGGNALDYRDLLPKREAHKAMLDRWLDKNVISYELTDYEGALTLTVALPRFLTDTYDVCAVDADDVCDTFYDVMLLFSGDTPKHALP